MRISRKLISRRVAMTLLAFAWSGFGFDVTWAQSGPKIPPRNELRSGAPNTLRAIKKDAEVRPAQFTDAPSVAQRPSAYRLSDDQEPNGLRQPSIAEPRGVAAPPAVQIPSLPAPRTSLPEISPPANQPADQPRDILPARRVDIASQLRGDAPPGRTTPPEGPTPSPRPEPPEPADAIPDRNDPTTKIHMNPQANPPTPPAHGPTPTPKVILRGLITGGRGKAIGVLDINGQLVTVKNGTVVSVPGGEIEVVELSREPRWKFMPAK